MCLRQTLEPRGWPIIEDMVALMIWLLVVAAIGFLIVVGVLRPARQSGHKASTVFTRRQAAKERKRLDTPVRSADERLSASSKPRSRGRHAAPPAPRRAPAAPASQQPIEPQQPIPPARVAPVAGTPAPAAPASAPAPEAASPAPEPTTPVAPVPATPAAAATPAHDVPAADDSVIDARTRWSRTDTESDSAEQADEPSTLDTEPLLPSGEQLRRAE